MKEHLCEAKRGIEIVQEPEGGIWTLNSYRLKKEKRPPRGTVTVHEKGDEWKNSGYYEKFYILVVQYCPFCGQKLEK